MNKLTPLWACFLNCMIRIRPHQIVIKSKWNHLSRIFSIAPNKQHTKKLQLSYYKTPQLGCRWVIFQTLKPNLFITELFFSVLNLLLLLCIAFHTLTTKKTLLFPKQEISSYPSLPPISGQFHIAIFSLPFTPHRLDC